MWAHRECKKKKRKKVLLCRKKVVQPHTFGALGSHKVEGGIQSYNKPKSLSSLGEV
jgi:hypothetical protein